MQRCEKNPPAAVRAAPRGSIAAEERRVPRPYVGGLTAIMEGRRVIDLGTVTVLKIEVVLLTCVLLDAALSIVIMGEITIPAWGLIPPSASIWPKAC